MSPKTFKAAEKKLKKADQSARLLMQTVDLKAVRKIQRERGEVRRKVVSPKAWLAHQKARTRKLDAFRNGPIPPELFAENSPISSAHRFVTSVSFSVPKGVFPMAFDACIGAALGMVAMGAGTMLSAKKAAVRDMDFTFATQRGAERAAAILRSVLATHRLKGKVVVEDNSWEPPRKIA